MKKKGKILVVDDNAGIRAALKILLPMHFAEVELIGSPNYLLRTVEVFHPDVVLLDMNFVAEINTGNEGLYWLGEIRSRWPELRVVLMTAYADVALAVEGMKRGAFDFVVKPWENEKLIAVLKAACEDGARGKATGGSSTAGSGSAQMSWGGGEEMAQIRWTVEKIAPTDATVLITGENGTGKDVLAGEICRMSLRSGKPLVSVDAGAIPDTLFESELFGHVKGAFTDAHADRKGLFEQADGGTIFLDEIGNISIANQAKLLRVLQNRTITRVGSSVATPIDIRLICATNADLERLVAEGKFRQDLYFRINTIHLRLPALRERREDIVPLAQLFLERYATKYRRSVSDIEASACDALKAYPWSGNIRELQNCIEKAVILSEGAALTVEDLGLSIDCHSLSGFAMTTPRHSATYMRHSEERSDVGISSHSDGLETLDEAEERLIRTAMDRHNGNMSLVAKALGITRQTLYNKLKKYGI